MRRLLVVVLVAALAGATGPVIALPAPPEPLPAPGLRAGVGVADMTWHVGASAGQYATDQPAVGTDPHLHSTKQQGSYGVQSRLSARALVLEGSNGERVALVKNDNYLAQDLLTRRVAQLLPAGLGLAHDRIVMSATHNHSSPYYSTAAAGVWIFQDVVDVRAFEYQARQIAAAITAAASDMRPARLGATTVDVGPLKGNIARNGQSDDGTPYGYPDAFGDHGVVVLRIDDVSDRKPVPLATWMNYGQHPESLDGYNLISGDFVAPLERFVSRDTSSTLVFTQGDVGSAEGPYYEDDSTTLPDGTVRAFAHVGYAQAERFARLLADAVVAGWEEIGAGGGQVRFTRNLPIGVFDGWIPGPVSHPYPAANACDTDTTLQGEPGVGAAASCERPGDSGITLADQVRENLEEHGIPVPDYYDMPAFGAVEENARIHLQAVRLGDILLASCSCEAQVDLILNLESRTDATTGNIWDGYDWAERDCARAVDGTWSCPTGGPVADAAIEHMRAQVHRPADGWDDPLYAPFANSEDPDDIKGNFTKTEIQAFGAPGYKLSVGLGHTGDYVGYTVSYREFMARDHYRKALTSYGPHTADYMVSRLVRMAAALQGGAPYDPTLDEPLGAVALADEQRQAAIALAAGQAAATAYDAYALTLPDDLDAGVIVEEPAESITRFASASFRWNGGSNYVDNPIVRVERRGKKGAWEHFAGQAGEIQTRLDVGGNVGETRRWEWAANFEAFDGFRPSEGQTPTGRYRFVVDGHHRRGGLTVPYRITSREFAVRPWPGVPVTDLRVEPDGAVSLSAAPHRYERSGRSAVFPALTTPDVLDTEPLCKTCSFRPWAATGVLAKVTVTVVRAAGSVDRVPAARLGSRWMAPTGLLPGDRAFVAAGDAVDTWGEFNGSPSAEVTR